jgi:hypothetical protein
MHQGLFQNVKVQGFGGSGYQIAPDSGAGWGMTWQNSTTVWNNIGINYVPLHEMDRYIGGTLSVNNTAVNLGSGTEFSLETASVDANATCGVAMVNLATLHVSKVHWENTGVTTTGYICGGTSTTSVVDMSGGSAQDDGTAGTGTNTTNWFVAGTISATNMQLTDFGRTTSVAVFAPNVRGVFDVLNLSQATLPIIANNIGVEVFTQTGPGIIPTINTPVISLPEISAPSGYQNGNIDNCYGDSTAHAVRCSYNAGAFAQVVTELTGTVSVTGTALAAGACDTNSVTITGANTSGQFSHVVATPQSAPSAPTYIQAFVSAANTVTVKMCVATASTPTTTTFNLSAF